MLETYIRSWYQKWFVDWAAELLGSKFSPMQMTFLSMFFGLTVPIFLMLHDPMIAVIMLLISGYFDTLDGTLARHCDGSTPLGAVLDIVSDRVVEFSVVFGLYLVDPIARSFNVICMLGSMFICITTFLVIGVFVKNDAKKGFFYSIGLMERAETFIFFILMILFPHWFNILAIIFTALVLWTAFFRLYKFVY